MNGIKRFQVASLILALMMLFGAGAVQAKLVPKIDNFILFPDQSGSMYMTYPGFKQSKMALVKQTLLHMNSAIPELGYKGAIDLFAPFEEVLAPMVFEQVAFSNAIQTIKDKQAIYGRQTPMGWGINGLAGPLSQVSGKTAIILLSDGEHNLGTDPIMEANALYSQFPNICFHVVSFATTPYGKSVLEQLAGLGNCVFADGLGLMQDPVAMDKFVRSIWYDEIPEALILRGIHFDYDKYNIKPNWAKVLDADSQVLNDNPDISVLLEGHTDNHGSVEYNQGLSERRAKSVYDYFVMKGIAPERMQTVGKSELEPIATNRTDEGRAINRRVEIHVMH
jgi:OOP family OmpA-OmpF porin